MTNNPIIDPLFGEPVLPVPLANAPLVKVLCQVRFHEILKISDRQFIAGFQEAVRKKYPEFREEMGQHISAGPGGVSLLPVATWRFYDVKRNWRITLMTTFISVETTKYVSREDFIERLEFLLKALGDTVGPSHVSRVGIRYVDQVEIAEGENISDILQPQMSEVPGDVNRMKHMLSEMESETAEGALLARWGFLPADGTHDPEIMPPKKSRSWFLDVDSFASYESEPDEYDPGKVCKVTYDLATRAYSFFRWCVNDNFLERFGKA